MCGPCEGKHLRYRATQPQHAARGRTYQSSYAATNFHYLVSTLGSFITIETPPTTALKAQHAKDHGLASLFFWMIEQDNGYSLNAVNHVFGSTLVADVADGKPGTQMATCGQNVTATACQALISAIK